MCCMSIPGSWAASSQSEAARRAVIKKKLRAFARSFFPVQRNTTRRTRPFFPQKKHRRQGGMPAKSAERLPAVPLRHRPCAFFGRGCPQGAQQPLYFSKKASIKEIRKKGAIPCKSAREMQKFKFYSHFPAGSAKYASPKTRGTTCPLVASASAFCKASRFSPGR